MTYDAELPDFEPVAEPDVEAFDVADVADVAPVAPDVALVAPVAVVAAVVLPEDSPVVAELEPVKQLVSADHNDCERMKRLPIRILRTTRLNGNRCGLSDRTSRVRESQTDGSA